MKTPRQIQLIVHIGMGKTGTTSIQRALATNAASLKSCDAEYIGMWFDMLDPKFKGTAGEKEFYAQSADRMAELAADFLVYLDDETRIKGIRKFILSNETFFVRGPDIAPFFLALKGQLDIRFIAYLREPREWLPSAFAQWGITNKVKSGPIRSFSEFAPELIARYEALYGWHERFAAELTVRNFTKEMNVVEDFASTVGVNLEKTDLRRLARREDAELLLRAFFNSKFEKLAPGTVFSGVFSGVSFDKIPSHSSLILKLFDHSSIDENISNHRVFFDFLREHYNISLGEDSDGPETTVDTSGIKDRLLDYAIGLSLNHAERIKQLEEEIRKLKGDRD